MSCGWPSLHGCGHCYSRQRDVTHYAFRRVRRRLHLSQLCDERLPGLGHHTAGSVCSAARTFAPRLRDAELNVYRA